jgi:hypothetical protein
MIRCIVISCKSNLSYCNICKNKFSPEAGGDGEEEEK